MDTWVTLINNVQHCKCCPAGGQSNLINNYGTAYRWSAGQKAGYSNAETIINNLSEGETIKFVTNSMGAVFQRGFSEGLEKYILEQQLQNLNNQTETRAAIKSLERRLSNPMGIIELDGENLTGVLVENLNKQRQKLADLQSEYQDLEDITIAIVVDIEPQDKTSVDTNAEEHYFIMSDESEYNTFEDNLLNIQPVEGATDASTKSDGTPVTTGHHSNFVRRPEDLPKPKN